MITRGVVCLLLFFMMGGCGQLVAQEAMVKAERVIENLLENMGEEEPASDAIETLYYFLDNPLDLNHADKEQLQDLFVLSPFQIQSLIDYRKKYGLLLSVYELQLIFGYNRELIEKIEPFIALQPHEERRAPSYTWSQFWKYSTHQLILRTQRQLERPSGFKVESDGNQPAYRGGINKYYLQYKSRFADFIRFGLTMEKDPGEAFFQANNPYGFDYYSGFLSVRNVFSLDALIIGDYGIRYGQGLTIWNGFSFGKNTYVLNVAKTDAPLDEYSSTDENRFFRGIALKKTLGNFSFSAFYSNKTRDANLEITAEEEKLFTSFQNSGYHRKESEIQDENAVREKVMGGNISFSHRWYHIGISGYHSLLDARCITGMHPRHHFEFSGNANTVAGLDYQLQTGHFYFFGEQALDYHDGWAFLNGVRSHISDYIGVSLLHRFYQPSYYSGFSGAFAEGSGTSNEEGLYLGIKLDMIPDVSLSLYVDSYTFPWLRHAVDAPSNGTGLFFNLNYSMGDLGNLYFRYRTKQKMNNFSNDHSPVNRMYMEKKHSYRFHSHIKLSDRFVLKNRLEYITRMHGPKDEKGWMAYQDLRYGFRKLPVQLDFRYAIFKTDSYQTAIYAYESDLLYAFSIPAYYDSGVRTYLLAHYNRKKFDIWMKVSRILFAEKEEIGSGTQLVKGNKKTELKLQLMFKW